jgi:hypothetical protein
MATDSEPANRSKSRVTVEQLVAPDEESVNRRFGRRPKYTNAVVDCICRALENGASRRAAYGSVGICRDTFQEWLKSKPTFSYLVERAEATAELKFTLIAHSGIENCTPEQALRWLERNPQTRKYWATGAVSATIGVTAGTSSDPNSTETTVNAQVTVTQRKTYNNDVLERYITELETEAGIVDIEAEAVTVDSDA